MILMIKKDYLDLIIPIRLTDHVSKSCGFIRSFQDVLANTLALKYFTEFMESEGVSELIKFCVEDHNFKVMMKKITMFH